MSVRQEIRKPFADLARTIRQARRGLKVFNPNQLRDDHGRWTDAGASGAAADAIYEHASSIDDVTSDIQTSASDLKDFLQEIESARKQVEEDVADYIKDFGPGTDDYDADTYEMDLEEIRKDGAENVAGIEESARDSYRDLSSHAEKLSARTKALIDKVAALAPKKT